MSSPSLLKIREHVEAAHREVRAAQDVAYGVRLSGNWNAPLGVRLALNRAQNILLKLLLHRLPQRG